MYFIFCFSCTFLIITSPSASAIIAVFPFCLLALLKIKGSIGPIFSFFLRDFLEAFLALHFYRELATRLSFKDIDLLDSESSPYTLGISPLNRNELYSIFIFKPLTSLKDNSRGTKVTGSNTDFSLILIVKASTKSL